MRYESKEKKPYRQPGTVKNWIYRRGDIYLANLNPFKGSEQGGTRPVLVLSNDTYMRKIIYLKPANPLMVAGTSNPCGVFERELCLAASSC